MPNDARKRFTCVATIASDPAVVFRPIFIFKRGVEVRAVRRASEVRPAGVVTTAAKASTTTEWICGTFADFLVETLQRQWQGRVCLLWDSCPSHTASESSQKFSLLRVCGGRLRVLVIPGSCTSIVQPLDVYLFRAFKRNVRKGMSALQYLGPTVEPAVERVFFIEYFFIS